MTVKLFHW